jgi:protein TonB
MNQRLIVVTAVVLAHIGGLWALQNGLLQRAIEVIIPVTVMAEVIEPAQPQVEPAAAPTPPAPAIRHQKTVPDLPAPTPPIPKIESSPVVLETPSALAPVVETSPAAPAQTPLATATASNAAPAASAATPAPPKIELPSSKADYLNNPRPPYPPFSKRMGEQGLVVVRALIEVNGTASKAEVKTSSGFDRLDAAALQAVLKWRYVPGKRNGEPQAMWFDVPIDFHLTPN